MTSPLVSICIPTYNGARFVRETLQSAVDQDYENLEILVSDHSSTDDTLAIIESFQDPRIRVSVLEAGGVAADNWNASCAGARGDFIKLLCQDDILQPSCISHQVDALLSMPQATFCFSPRDVISPRGRRILRARCFRPSHPLISRQDALRTLVRSGTNIFGEPCAVLMRSAHFRQAPQFSGSYLIDLNMWIALWSMGPALFLDECDSQFRISGTSWTSNLKSQQAVQFQQLLHSLANSHQDLCSASDVKRGERMSRIHEAGRLVLIGSIEILHL